MLPKGCKLRNEPKPSAAANLLLASRTKSGSSQDSLLTALGKHPLTIHREAIRAEYPGLTKDTRIKEPGSRSNTMIAEAVGRTRNPLASITELGVMVRTARKAMKMNQAEFAAHAGVGRRFVSELEGGKPSLEFDKVLGCATAAGIDVFAKKRGS